MFYSLNYYIDGVDTYLIWGMFEWKADFAPDLYCKTRAFT